MKLTIEFRMNFSRKTISFYKGEEEELWDFVDTNCHRISNFEIKCSTTHAASCGQDYEVNIALEIAEYISPAPDLDWSIEYLCGTFLE